MQAELRPKDPRTMTLPPKYLRTPILVLALALAATAAAQSFDGSGPLHIRDFTLLESPRQERSHLDLAPGTPGSQAYAGGLLPAGATPAPKMYTFRAGFKVDASMAGQDLALYLGLFEYPYRVYLNGTEIFKKGRYGKGQYNSSLRVVNSVFLSPDLLRHGDAENVLIIEAFPEYEAWGLDTIWVDRQDDVAAAVFLRNFIGINLIQGAFLLALIIGLYFLALYLQERRRQARYLFFGLICFSFCLSYFGVTVHFEANNEPLLEALSKAGLVLMSSCLVLYCGEAAGLRGKARLAPRILLAVGLLAAAGILLLRHKQLILRWFGVAMNFVIVPQLLADLVILGWALFHRRNLYVLPLLTAFLVVISTALHDVWFLNHAALPFAWMSAYGYLAVVVSIFVTLAREQGDLYHQSLQQTADLVINSSRIESLNHQLTRQKDAFFRFVPTQFLELLGKESVVDIKPGDASLQRLGVLFSDIRQFTTRTERMSPAESFEFINGYLARMERAIQRNSGFVDKYIGDAIMALFAAPAKGGLAGRGRVDATFAAALGMCRELVEFNKELAARGLPDIDIGIGIHAGEVMLGTVGSENRLDTTVIGDTVNLSSRLERLTKRYRTRILVSEQAVGGLEDPGAFSLRLVDHVSVAGRDEPLRIYELLDPAFPQDAVRIVRLSQLAKAQELYFSQRFAEAQPLFAELAASDDGDYLPRIYKSRCTANINLPPGSDWDGICAYDVKELTDE
jgi:adenylate cyclase